MPCNSCSSEFGILKKEVGCEVCGFSFCTRCCKKREVPSKPKQLICNKCYDYLINKKPATGSASPPLAHKKRMEALKKQSFSVDSASEWPNEKDKEIAERLQRLKRDRIKDDVPSEDDIAARLAKLKGMDPAKFKAPPIQVYRPPNLRTTVEEASDLMKQVTLEVELDSRLVKPEDEIAARLARLRDQVPVEEKEPTKPRHSKDTIPNIPVDTPAEDMDMDIDKATSDFQEQSKSLSTAATQEIQDLINDPEYQKVVQDIPKTKDENEESEEEANRLVAELLATNDDVEELDSLNDDIEESNSKSDQDTTEEFPWCIICTEDAKIRCFGCDSDLYCMRCYKECHDSLDIRDHKTCPYMPRKNSAL